LGKLLAEPDRGTDCKIQRSSPTYSSCSVFIGCESPAKGRRQKLLAVKSIALKMIIFFGAKEPMGGKSILARRKRNLKDYDEGCVVFVWCLLIVYIIG
jgi:hypothetical protein